MNKKFLFFLFLWTFMISSLFGEEEKTIILVTYNLNSDYQKMAKFYRHIQKIKQKHPSMLLLDTGKQLNFKNFYTKITDGLFNIQVMNFMGYNGASPCVSTFFYRKKNLESSLYQSKFPWISTNVFTNKNIYKFPPYWIYKLQHKQIALLSVCSSKKAKKSLQQAFLGKMSIKDEENSLQKFLPSLKQRANLILLSSSSGALSDTYLATKFGSIDLILGVSSHAKKPYMETINDVHTLWQEESGRWMCEITITWKKNQNRSKVASMSLRLIDSQTLSPHPKFISFLKENSKTIPKEKWNQKISTWNQKFFQSKKGKKELVLLCCKSIQEETKAEVILLHWPTFQKKIMTKQKMTKKDLWKIFPLSSNIFEILVTGKKLKSILERSPGNGIFIYGIFRKKTKKKTLLYVGDQLLREKQNYHVVSCMGGIKKMEDYKILSVIEGDFFKNFVENLQNSNFLKEKTSNFKN